LTRIDFPRLLVCVLIVVLGAFMVHISLAVLILFREYNDPMPCLVWTVAGVLLILAGLLRAEDCFGPDIELDKKGAY